jgi:hypothetical protein
MGPQVGADHTSVLRTKARFVGSDEPSCGPNAADGCWNVGYETGNASCFKQIPFTSDTLAGRLSQDFNQAKFFAVESTPSKTARSESRDTAERFLEHSCLLLLAKAPVLCCSGSEHVFRFLVQLLFGAKTPQGGTSVQQLFHTGLPGMPRTSPSEQNRRR